MSKSLRQSKRSFLQKYILDFISAGVVWVFYKGFSILPVRVASNLGAGIGFVLYFLMPGRNAIGLRNLEIAFPEKTVNEHKIILKKMWQHWGRFFAEMPHGEELWHTGKISGLSHLKKIAKEGKGCFVCSAHFGNWEPAVSVPLFDQYYLNPVYRAANNPWIDKIMFQRRKGVLIPKGSLGAKKMLEVLKSGGAVVILCDQKLREGIEVPFFGKLAKTPSSMATAALKMNVPILMADSRRLPNGQIAFSVHAPLQFKKTNNKEEAIYDMMLQINACIEGWIRDVPEQWLWIHRRFDKSLYKK